MQTSQKMIEEAIHALADEVDCGTCKFLYCEVDLQEIWCLKHAGIHTVEWRVCTDWVRHKSEVI